MNNIDSATLNLLKNFIYLGNVQVPIDQVHEFIRIGGELGIEGLVEQPGEQSTYIVEEDEKEREKTG